MDEENHPEQDEGEDDAAKGETDDRDHDDDDDDDVDDDYNSHEDEDEHENEDEDDDFLTLNFPLCAQAWTSTGKMGWQAVTPHRSTFPIA